jgi:predicted transcriptional regulator of viral defense system
MPSDALPQIIRAAGIITAAELRAAGKSREQIKTLLRRGTLVRVDRGVFARAARADNIRSLASGGYLLRLAGMLAVSGPGTVVSHQSAAQLYGIDLLDRPDPAVTLTCGREHRWRARSGIRLHAVAIPAAHVTSRFGAPVTTAARTVVDLARTLDFRAGVVAADSALHRKLTTKGEMAGVIKVQRRWPGITRAAQVLDFADERAESPLESIARVLFRDLGLPAPELQVWLGGVEQAVGRVDFYWKHHRTIVEVDGKGKYQDPERARWQLRRDDLLRADGYEVVHLTWYDITHRPDEVRTLIRKAFERGRAARTSSR